MNSNEIAVTTTASANPELLNKTYASFFKNIKGIDLSKCVLYINIDPVGGDQKETLEVAHLYFDTVICRIPEKPNFPAAVNWVWSSADTPYILNLEFDWLLEKEIDMEKVSLLMKNNIHILEIAFRAYMFEYNKPSLSPGIWRYELYKVFAGNLRLDMNPEVQLRFKRFAKYFNFKNIGVLGNVPIIKDIGRDWTKKIGLVKPPVKNDFINYEKETRKGSEGE